MLIQLNPDGFDSVRIAWRWLARKGTNKAKGQSVGRRARQKGEQLESEGDDRRIE